MDKLRNMFNIKIDDKQKNLLLYAGLGIGGFIVIVIVISLLVNAFSLKYLSYEEVEENMVIAAKQYYDQNKSFLPTEINESTSVKYVALVNANLIKPIKNVLKNGKICEAEVVVTKVDNTYDYTPYLTCGTDYSSIQLYKIITKEENIVTEKSGLYRTGNGYVFRGEQVNNYLQLGGNSIEKSLFRIVKIDEYNNIAVIFDGDKNSDYHLGVWDDRFNADVDDTFGINNYNLSRIKDTLNTIYNLDQYITAEQKSKVVLRKWCIGEHPVDKAIGFEKYECSEYSEEEIPYGLISVSEYMTASLDNNCLLPNDYSCINYNYLYNDIDSWTITKGGETSSHIYSIGGSGLSTSRAMGIKKIRIMFYLNNKTVYKSGSGTYTDPYIIR